MKRELKKYGLVLIALPLILFLSYQTVFTNSFKSLMKRGIPDKANAQTQPQIKPQGGMAEEKPVPVIQKVIVIDPGHGGEDLGTLKKDLIEKEITLNISRKVRTYLLELGYKVLMTRDGDEPLYKMSDMEGSRARKDLDSRVKFAAENKADLYVSIHIDSKAEDPGQKGAMVYYYPKLAMSETYAVSIQKALNDIKIDNKKRVRNFVQKQNFYVIKHAVMPSVLIETAHLTNSEDRRLLRKESFIDELAKAISNGIHQVK